jgi:hypothetical protein
MTILTNILTNVRQKSISFVICKYVIIKYLISILNKPKGSLRYHDSKIGNHIANGKYTFQKIPVKYVESMENEYWVFYCGQKMKIEVSIKKQ